MGGAALRRGRYPPQESGLEGVREAEIGAFETCRQALKMSVYRGRSEVADPCPNDAIGTHCGLGRARVHCPTML